jgi:hypothetical protein
VVLNPIIGVERGALKILGVSYERTSSERGGLPGWSSPLPYKQYPLVLPSGIGEEMRRAYGLNIT